jgi:hypothetical protein
MSLLLNKLEFDPAVLIIFKISSFQSISVLLSLTKLLFILLTFSTDLFFFLLFVSFAVSFISPFFILFDNIIKSLKRPSFFFESPLSILVVVFIFIFDNSISFFFNFSVFNKLHSI